MGQRSDLNPIFCIKSCAFCKPYLAPNTPHVRLLSLSGNGGLVLGLVDVGAPLAHIPASLLLVGGALDKHFADQFKNVEWEIPGSGEEQCSRAGSSDLSCSQ